MNDPVPHIWKPLLHEVAAGSLNPYEDELNYFAQAQRNGFAFQPGRMLGIDRVARTIRLDEMQDDRGATVVETRDIPYDWLVVAIGSTTNDFGTPGAREHCVCLDTRGEAERFHRSLLNCYYRAKAQGHPGTRLDIAIVGGGATGVELAADRRLREMGIAILTSEQVTEVSRDGIRTACIGRRSTDGRARSFSC